MGAFDNYQPVTVSPTPSGGNTGGAFSTYQPVEAPGIVQQVLGGDVLPQGGNVDAFTDLIARAGASLFTGPADAGTLLARYLAGEPLTQSDRPMPSERFNRYAGIEMAPDAGPAMQTADVVAPWLIPSPAAVSRISEAPTMLARGAGLLRHGVGGMIDLGASQAAAGLAEQAGADQPAQIAAALLGSAARPVAARAGAAGMRSLIGAPQGGAIFDASTAAQGPGTLPTFGMVTTPTGKGIEKAVGALPIAGYPVDAARARNVAAAENAVSRATGLEAPEQPSVTAQGVIDAAQQQTLARRVEESNRQAGIERRIGPETEVNVSPILDVIRSTAGRVPGGGSPAIGEAFKESLRAREPHISADIEAMNPGARQNVETWQAEAARVQQENAAAQAAFQAAQTPRPVTLTGRNASGYVANLAGTLTPRQLFDLNVRLKQGRGSITVNPNDPGYAAVAPPPPVAPAMQPVPPVPALPQTAGYGAVKDLYSDLNRRMEGMPALQQQHLEPLAGAITDVRRQAAAGTPGVGAAEFDAAQQAYARLHNQEIPWLGAQGGFAEPIGPGGLASGAVRWEGTPTESAITGRLQRGVGPNESFIRDMQANLGPDVTRQAVAAIIRGMGSAGKADPSMRPDRLATDLATVNPEAMAALGPQAATTLGNVQTAGRAYGTPRDQMSLTKAAGLGGVIAKLATPAMFPVAALTGSALESPDMVRAMAGRTQYMPLLQQALSRAALAGQQRGGL